LPESATRNDWYLALAHAVRDRLLDRWIEAERTLMHHDVRSVSYLSAEFLMGPHLGNNLLNLGILEEARQAVETLGLSLDELLEQEEEPGLGNGGLGRLAACYLDSLATLEIPAVGYGIRYEFGIFDQIIRDGWQVEITDKWLHLGNPWEIPRPEINFYVNLGGHTETYRDPEGQRRVRWIPYRVVKGVAYDTPVLGYKVSTTNQLRLWKAEAVESFDFEAFNLGDYYRAVSQKVLSENIGKVLYPNDSVSQGRQLRLEQQYFLASCSLQDMIRVCLASGNALRQFHKHFAVQLNDTHPSIAIAELMRLLVDEHLMDWDAAWEITQQSFAYTNHTLLPEALEKWPVEMFGRVLPRHLEIIYEINHRFLDRLRVAHGVDDAKIRRLSLIDETGERYVRMAHLASLGSHTINGVAPLHSALLKQDVLRDFHEVFPERFRNITNGVTPRRWVALGNPRLAGLITSRIGESWIRHTEEELSRLEAFVEDAGFAEEWRRVKLANKQDLAKIIKDRVGMAVDPESLFDIQVKRFHEYKRQHLNILHVISLYLRLRNDPRAALPPRTVIFGGKAAPGYAMAKLIIKLINSVAEVVNRDPAVAGRLSVVFFPDFNVKHSLPIYAAADLSEQISMAGKEASGTGNMKFAMNGALTIGTLDGANIDIREAVGQENFFQFGLSADEISAMKANGYVPRACYDRDPVLRESLDLIAAGFFSNGRRDLFAPLLHALLSHDEYFVLADHRAYQDCQDRAGWVFLDREQWTRKSILNTARVGKFSSDRSIREYCEHIWNVRPVRTKRK
jgi:starch phosphorylase